MKFYLVNEILFVINRTIFAFLEKILRKKFIGQTPETDLGNSVTTVQIIFWDFKTGKFPQVSPENFSKIFKAERSTFYRNRVRGLF